MHVDDVKRSPHPSLHLDKTRVDTYLRYLPVCAVQHLTIRQVRYRMFLALGIQVKDPHDAYRPYQIPQNRSFPVFSVTWLDQVRSGQVPKTVTLHVRYLWPLQSVTRQATQLMLSYMYCIVPDSLQQAGSTGVIIPLFLVPSSICDHNNA